MKSFFIKSIYFIKKRLYLIVFISLITIPLVQLWGNPFNDHLINEKRAKAQRPYLNLKLPISSYLNAYEKYFDDNFGFREYLIDIANTVKVKVFHKSSNDSVILGKDDYLFAKGEEKDYNNSETLSDEKIDKIAEHLSLIQKQLSERGMYFVFSVAPNKSTIYPEFMPLPPTNPNGENNLAKLEKALKKHSVNYLSFKDLMLKNKGKYPLYFKRDTHWNLISSVLAANDFMDCLKKKFPIEGGSLSFDNIHKKDKEGDLDDLLGIYNPYPECTCDLKTIAPKTKFPKTLTYVDSFCESVMPLTDVFFNQRLDMHNVNAPIVSNFYLYSNNASVVFFEMVERFIPSLVNYNFDVYNDTTKDVPKDLKPYDINVDFHKSKINDMKFKDVACEDDKNGGYYYASKSKDSYITWNFGKEKHLDYLYLDLSFTNTFNRLAISWSDEESGDFPKANTSLLQLTPIKTKYLIDLRNFDTKAKRLKIQIGDSENSELNLSKLQIFGKDN